jgi:lipoprotein NlpD
MRPSSLFSLSNPRTRYLVAMVVVAALAAGCATRRPAPVEERANAGTPPPAAVPSPAPAVTAQPSASVPTYTVKRGDTLHQIALDTGLDYRELAAWNNIENVNVIRVGQVLRLVAPGETPMATVQEGATGVTIAPLRAPPPVVESRAGATAAATPPGTPSTAPSATQAASAPVAAATAAGVKTSPKAIKEPYSDQAVRELTLAASSVPAPPDTLAMAAPGGVRVEPKAEPRATAPSPAVPAAPAPSTSGDGEQLDWAWPVKGKVIAGFSETANLKGIDIAGTAGQAVHASAAGRVVYAGAGLRGYGKLIIIKHNAMFLSAYAHNREILVKEGQQVTRGQKIAEMGNTDADQVKLHFEIRRQGKPMDPTKYLPPA